MIHPSTERGRIFSLEARPPDDTLFVVSQRGATLFEASNTIIETIEFDSREDLLYVEAKALCTDEPLSFLALAVDSDEIVLLDSEGKERVRIPTGIAGKFATADFDADGCAEIVVESPGNRGVTLWSTAGTRLDRITTADYLTAFRMVTLPEDPEVLLVLYTYPNRERGGTFEIVDPRGERIHRWDYAAIGSFGVVQEEGEDPQLLTAAQDRLQLLSLRGNLLEELDAPNVQYLRDLQSLPLPGDGLVVVASGGGYVPHHMVLVYDGQGELVFQQIGDGRAYALAPSAVEPGTFYVGVERTIIRYRTQTPLREASRRDPAAAERTSRITDPPSSYKT